MWLRTVYVVSQGKCPVRSWTPRIPFTYQKNPKAVNTLHLMPLWKMTKRMKSRLVVLARNVAQGNQLSHRGPRGTGTDTRTFFYLKSWQMRQSSQSFWWAFTHSLTRTDLLLSPFPVPGTEYTGHGGRPLPCASPGRPANIDGTYDYDSMLQAQGLVDINVQETQTFSDFRMLNSATEQEQLPRGWLSHFILVNHAKFTTAERLELPIKFHDFYIFQFYRSSESLGRPPPGSTTWILG